MYLAVGAIAAGGEPARVADERHVLLARVGSPHDGAVVEGGGAAPRAARVEGDRADLVRMA